MTSLGWWWWHLAAVTTSLSFFTVRWVAALLGRPWVWARTTRAAAVLADSVLLMAGVGLMLTRGWWPTVPVWLWFKWCLLVLYIMLGHLALRTTVPARTRVLAGVVALVVAAHIVGAAVAHHPAGFWFAAGRTG
ncbi:putative membrane protein SirB2 [Tepidimonas ignava]|uniref:Expression up-regulator, SirB n=1 Tax=Tepidimonas ignava TaxID=114249 RepID=A0A4V2UVK1_9BURK|nr:SirB2 family protein [Tepidimonas ignava]TCS96097.1 putative membrane protein SirB2 [Tepidimonas ignava]TSE21117.1 expression up-regulator, SirB [Tepidimonas ignava]